MADDDSADRAHRVVRGGRPPSRAHRRAALVATRTVLAEVGYERLTLEAVAREAGSYRRYLNRTWRSKAELVRDAVFEEVPAFATPDTGTLTGDLHALIGQHVDLTLRPEFLRAVPSLQAEFRIDPELWATTRRRHVAPAADGFDTVLTRAMARGEIAGHVGADLVVGTVSGTIQQLAGLGLLDRDGLVEHAVRVVARGLVDPPFAPGETLG